MPAEIDLPLWGCRQRWYSTADRVCPWLHAKSGSFNSVGKPTKLLSLERRTDSTLNKRDENGLMYVVICMKISYVIFNT